MMPAAKAFDPVLGVDIHIIQPPGPVPPVPIPHPFVGFLFDPIDFVPFVGASVQVNGLPRATAGTGATGKPPHIPIGGVFVMPPSNDGELFMGSATVLMDGDPASHMVHPVLTCQSVGMPSPPRKKAKTKPKSLVLPTSVVLPIPMGLPVLVGGPPTISMMALGMKVAFAGLARLASSRIGQRVRRGFQELRQRACRNMPPGFVKCTLLRAEPVHVVTGEVVVEQQDFALPWGVPLRWTRRYGSQQARYGACGRGWETPADARLEFEPDGGVTFRDGSAGAAVFAALPEPGGAPEAELVAGATLARAWDVEGAEWLVVRTRPGLRYWFAPPPWGAREVTVSHVMDGCDNWLQFVRGPGGLAEVRDSSGQRVVAETAGGRVHRLDLVDPDTGALLPLVRYEYGGGARAVDDLTAVVDALGEPYRFAYDGARRLVRHTDRAGLSFHYAYDGPGQDARCVHAWGDGGLYDYAFAWEEDAAAGVGRAHVRDSLGHVSTVEYDPATRLPLHETDPLGGVTAWEYDAAGRCAAEVKPWGARTAWEYDDAGRLLRCVRPDASEVRVAYDAAGHPVALTDALGARWEEEYDARGLLRRRVEPSGAAWTFAHAGDGALQSVTDPLGQTTTVERDARGRRTAHTSPAGAVTRVERDAFGNPTARIDPAGHRTEYGYDAKGRLVWVRDALGGVTRCGYDAADRLARLEDELGRVTEFRHAGLGRLVERRNPDGTRLRFAYDTEERPRGIENERGEVHRVERDALGRVVRNTDFWGHMTVLRYAGSGPLAAVVDPRGATTTYAFDARGRLTERSHEGAAPETYAYDAGGRLALAANADATVARRYDAAGRLVHELVDGFVVESQYDAAGRRVARRSGYGTDVRFAYDAAGAVAEVTVADVSVCRVERDARRLPTREWLAGGAHRTRGWDALGQLVQQTRRGPGGSSAVRRYAYDAAGNLVARADPHEGTTRYEYDARNRVVRATNGAVQHYRYDPAGDRLHAPARATANGLPPGHRITHAAEGASEGAYEFDPAGNLVRRTTPRGTARFCWDGANRLREALTEDGRRVTYRYDALGRRLSKRVDDATTVFRWDGDVLLGEERAPAARHELVCEPGSFAVLAAVAVPPRGWPPTLLHFENDQIGLARDVVPADGTPGWAGRYDAFGRLDAGADALGAAWDNPVRLQGQYADPETGLHYARHRYYDPAVGAFISADPLGLAAGVNPYRYAPNVWNWIDPLGLTCAAVQARIKNIPESPGIYHVEVNGRFYTGSGVDVRDRLLKGDHPASKLMDDPNVVITVRPVDLGTATTPRQQNHVLRNFEQETMDDLGNIPQQGGSVNQIRAARESRVDEFAGEAAQHGAGMGSPVGY